MVRKICALLCWLAIGVFFAGRASGAPQEDYARALATPATQRATLALIRDLADAVW